MTREDVIEAALSMRGVRFRHQGRSKETGVDCMGLLYCVLQDVGYPRIVDVEGYKASPPASVIYETLCDNFDEIRKEDALPGDIFLLRPGAKARHAAILLSDTPDYEKGIVPEIIHAYGMGGQGTVMVEPLENWAPKIVTAFRLRGIE